MHRIRTAVTAFALLGAALTAPASVTAASAAPAKLSVAECASVSNLRVARGRDNGSDPNDLSRAAAAKAERTLAARIRAKGLSPARLFKGKVKIDVFVHVITREDGTGGVTRKQIKEQIAVLNAGYSGSTAKRSASTIFKFATKKIDYTNNDDWYDWSLYDDSDDAEAKKALHKGGFDDLNLYITGLADGLLGYSEFPFETTLQQDGVVVLNESLPGGSVVPYNEGDTLTHEAGHWLGLFHTFENGCTAPGDSVKDTPAQADGDNIFYCNESDDTCPAKGKDPVHNFMSYGDDPCLDRFTTGQGYRMASVWYAYRAGGGGY